MRLRRITLPRRALRLAGLSALGLGTSLSIVAQERGASSATGAPVLDEVTVTAQKISQRELDVPVSVSTLDARPLIEQNLTQISDYYQRIPGLQYAGGLISDLSLRGVTTGGGATISTLAVYVDDVPFGGSSFIASQPFPDLDPSLLDHIEVLRGPQGTLYGASSLGGLIKFVTKDPDPNNWFGRVEVGGSGSAAATKKVLRGVRSTFR